MDPRRRGAPPAPVIFPGDEPFWAAAREGRWLAKRCQDCGRLHYYPRMHCPFCGSGRVDWQALSGRGHLHSHSIVERAPRPTAPAIVEIEEGLRVHGVVLDADVQRLRIGDEVRLRFVPSQDGTPVPAFTTPQADRARDYTRAAHAALEAGTASGSDHRFEHAAVVGAGHMGVGISLALLAAGLPVMLIDAGDEALAAARRRIGDSLAQDRDRGRITADEAAARLDRLQTDTRLERIATADVVIEAIWEDPQAKRTLFADLDRHARPGALLASNTSTLDVALLASATTRPGDVIGLHFFNPAQVMRLVEVVRPATASQFTVERARAFARALGKVAVVVGVCDGFVGNRMMIARERQAARLLLEGALPQQVDQALRRFGLPMGTFELQDMAGGIALTHRARQRSGQRDWLIEQLFEQGRTGLAAGRGYYRYEPGQRRPLPDPAVRALIEEASRREGLERRPFSDAEIVDRLVLPMINEGAKLLEEGIVERASDIDLVWQHGYGWPDWKGGPMHHADERGLPEVVARLHELHARHGEVYRPAALLERLAQGLARLSDMTRSAAR